MPKEPELHTFRNRLPQWRLTGSVYLVTWRLSENQAPLAPAERSVVVSAIKHFHDQRYRLLAYVVMDNHVHVLVQPLGEVDLSAVLHSWKSFAANRLQREHRRTGSVWQKDSHTRIIRTEDELYESAAYVLDNPRRRWPETASYEWAEYM